ncbi:(2Fe-2S) ferredoxin domain-containing protein [Candidatus Woesearchaeota archaeon]|nr:(2Fe-2S) ferredoxin domain-containing protein [Candidatus Woesearchaeota archaeon]
MQDLPFKPRMHVFICVNDRTGQPNDPKPSCGPTISTEMYKEVKQWTRTQGWTNQVYVTKVSCLGFCNPEGGVMCVWPQGRFVKGIQTVDDMKKVISEEYAKVMKISQSR